MSLNIKSAEADRLVEALSDLTGETKTRAGIVVDSQIGTVAGRQLDLLVARSELRVEAVTREHADIARQAYLDFGKGNHPAGLDFGDCFAYALSKSTGHRLLFKGADFTQTDILPALA